MYDRYEYKKKTYIKGLEYLDRAVSIESERDCFHVLFGNK